MSYEESNFSKLLPTRFIYEPFKVLEWKWFNGNKCVGAVLVWDLSNPRFIAFLGCGKKYNIEEDDVKEIVEWGCRLPNDITLTMFKNYFSREEVYPHLDKTLKVFMNFTELLNE